MSESWFCLILGAELGPTSWDDLALAIARGELRPGDRVRRGSNSEWRQVAEVDGLLAAAAALRPMAVSLAPGAELTAPHDAKDDDTAFDVDSTISATPAADELDFEINTPPALVSSGEVDLKTPVPRPAAAEELEFDLTPPAAPASREVDVKTSASLSVATDELDFELTTPPAPASSSEVDANISDPRPAAADELDFELTTPPTPASPSDVDVQISPPDLAAADDGTDFEISTHAKPAAAVELPAAAAEDDDFATALLHAPDLPPSREKPIEAAESEAPNPVESAEAPPQATATTSAPPAIEIGVAATAIKKPPEKKKSEKKQARREGPRFELSAGLLKGLMVAVGISCLAGASYLAYLSLGPSYSPNCDAVLASYQQLYDEVSKIRESHGAEVPPDTQKKFVDAVNAARQPLANAEPGTVEDRLYQAGPFLVEMFANAAAQPESEAEMRYINSEKGYQDLVISARGELGK